MSLLPYTIPARGLDGAPLAGLKPTWQYLMRRPSGEPLPRPPIVEAAPGDYEVMIDPTVTGEALGRIDMGPTAAERYHTLAIYRTDAPTVSPVVTPAAGTVTLDAATVAALAQAVAAALTAPATTPQATLDALTAAAQSLADLAGKLGNPGKGNKG